MLTISQRTKQIIAQRLDVERWRVTDEANLIGDLEADSLDKIQLCMAFEEEFSCHIPDDLIETIITVRDVVSVIEFMQTQSKSATG